MYKGQNPHSIRPVVVLSTDRCVSIPLTKNANVKVEQSTLQYVHEHPLSTQCEYPSTIPHLYSHKVNQIPGKAIFENIQSLRPVSLNPCRTRLTSMVNKCYIRYLQHPLKHDSEAVLTNTKPCQWNPNAKEPLCTSPFNRFALASFTKSTKKSLTQITIWRSLCEKRNLPPTLSSQMCQEYLHLLYL